MSAFMLSVSGCRGILGDTMTPAIAERFASAFARHLLARAADPVAVVVGRDGRRGSAEIQAGAMRGLGGCRVLDIGVATTPTVAVAVDEVRRRHAGLAVAGLVITASHNPQPWCGLKCLVADAGAGAPDVSACAPAPEEAQRIIALFRNPPPGDDRAEPVRQPPDAFLGERSAAEVHVGRVLHALRTIGVETPQSLGEGLCVALDSVNASGAEAGRLLLESLGCEDVIHLGAESSGVFPHPPEPTVENLSLPRGLCDAVRENACDLGFAQDPDADRLAIIDERGRYIGEEYTLALGALSLLEAARRAGATPGAPLLVTNLSTSRLLTDVAGRFGATVARTPVGEAHVVAAMKRDHALCGGEGNGGLIWPRVAFVRDSLSGMALTLALLAGSGRTLSAVVRDLPAYAIEKRKVSLPRPDLAAPALERLAAAFAHQRIDRQDGVWVDFTSGPHAGRAWLHVRASNTEPILRLIAEAPTPADAGAILDQAARLVAL
jgi:phosphomannomutase